MRRALAALLFHLAWPLRADGVFLVCYAFMGPVTDLGWTYSHNLARAWADDELGTTSKFVESVAFMPEADQHKVMDGFVADGCGLIVVGSDIMWRLAVEYAGRHPGLKVICLGDAKPRTLPNLASAYVRVHQVSYVAGVLAAMQPGVRNLGYIGSVYQPSSIRNINAFALGARSVRPDARVYVSHVGSWFDPRSEEIAGRRLFLQHGVDLLVYDSDSTTVVALARTLGRFSIAKKADGTALYGESNLMSQIYVWDRIFVRLISAAMGNTSWEANRDLDAHVGFDRGGLSLGTFSAQVPASSRIQAKRIVEALTAGQEAIFCGALRVTCPMHPTSPPCVELGGLLQPQGGAPCFSDEELKNVTWFLKDTVVDLGPLDVPAVCRPGTRMDALSPALCVPCLPGTYSNKEDDTNCTACPPGSYDSPLAANASSAAAVGATSCQRCPRGTRAAAASGATACLNCTPGSFSPEEGATECAACPLGTYTAAEGVLECAKCAPGEFQDAVGQTACVACGANMQTLLMGAESRQDCKCRAGYYLPRDSRTCKICGEGLLCAFGAEEANTPSPDGVGHALSSDSPYPTIMEKYFASAEAPLSLYRCGMLADCPGGIPGVCPKNHLGLTCARCADRHYRAPFGGCQACQPTDVLPAAIGAPVLILAILAIMVYNRADMSTHHSALTSAAVIAGQLVFSVQMMGVIQQFKVVWAEPLASVLRITALVNFDVRIFKLECVLGRDTTVMSSLAQLLALPIMALAMGLSMLVSNLMKDKANRFFTWDRYHNSVGLLVLVVYVPVTTSMLQPLYCIENPNGTRAMSAKRSVLCWQSDEHAVLLAIGLLGLLLYPVNLLARVAYASWRYPAMVARDGGLRLLERFRFVFKRFRAGAFWFSFWYLLRNLALALVPVLFADSAVLQVACSSVVVLLALATVASLKPWRTWLINVSDVAFLLSMALFLQAAAFLVTVVASNEAVKGQVISYILLAIVLCMIGVLVAMASYAMAGYLRPRRRYAFFLSHHKQGAGCLARWFKVQMVSLGRVRVFLDSDALDELDLIVDTVRGASRNVVLILTQLTLSRLWCGAEIAAAYMSHVPIIQVACGDFVAPDLNFLASLDDCWSEPQKSSLAQYGIVVEHIREAYAALSNLSVLPLDRFAPIDEQREVVAKVLRACGARLTVAVTEAPHLHHTRPEEQAKIAVVGASGDAEARITCELLQLYLQRRLSTKTVVLHSGEEAEVHAGCAAYLLTVLTRGVLNDAGFAAASTAFARAQARRVHAAEIVTTLADTSFEFPSPDVFSALEREGEDEKLLARHLRKVFNILSLPFTPQSSEEILEVQTEQLCRRFRGLKKGVMHSNSAASASSASGPGGSPPSNERVSERSYDEPSEFN